MRSTNELGQSGQAIQLFTNPSFGTVRMAGTERDPLFCLADICKAVELTNPSSVKARLDAEDVQLIDLHALNSTEGGAVGNTHANFVTESGFFDVLLQSSSPKVKPFRKWVTSEVLPAIRKTGGYIHEEEGDTDADIMAKALMIAHKTIEDKKQRIQILEGENKSLQVQNQLLAPKAQYTDEVLQASDTITLTQAAKELNFRSINVFLKKLYEDHIMFKQSGQWLPTARYSAQGYFKSRTHRFFHNDGRLGASITTVVTQKGREFLHRHFKVAFAPVDFSDPQIGGAL